MSAVFIHGLGAVSPAGWGVAALQAALEKNQPLPVQMLAAARLEKTAGGPFSSTPALRPAFLSHPRLRRAGIMAQHTLAAALEALGADAALVQTGALRLGIIVCTMAGGVAYSRRFYEEVLQEPATASPLIFPETVFNAPASHLAAYLNSPAINYTLVGDDGAFFQGLALAAGLAGRRTAPTAAWSWARRRLDWIIADAVRLFRKSAVYTGGAGALYLKKHPEAGRFCRPSRIPFRLRNHKTAPPPRARCAASLAAAGRTNCFATAKRLIRSGWTGPAAGWSRRPSWANPSPPRPPGNASSPATKSGNSIVPVPASASLAEPTGHRGAFCQP